MQIVHNATLLLPYLNTQIHKYRAVHKLQRRFERVFESFCVETEFDPELKF